MDAYLASNLTCYLGMHMPLGHPTDWLLCSHVPPAGWTPTQPSPRTRPLPQWLWPRQSRRCAGSRAALTGAGAWTALTCWIAMWVGEVGGVAVDPVPFRGGGGREPVTTAKCVCACVCVRASPCIPHDEQKKTVYVQPKHHPTSSPDEEHRKTWCPCPPATSH